MVTKKKKGKAKKSKTARVYRGGYTTAASSQAEADRNVASRRNLMIGPPRPYTKSFRITPKMRKLK